MIGTYNNKEMMGEMYRSMSNYLALMRDPAMRLVLL